MIEVRRLLVAGAVLGMAALVSYTSVLGQAGRDKEAAKKEDDLRAWRRGESVIHPVVEEEAAPTEDLSKNRFADQPAVAYRTVAGDTLVALQILPTLPDEPARPTDYLVIVDTSASKAMGHLAAAVTMVEELRKKLGADDRLAIWTANIKPTDLTHGFKSGADLDNPIKDLQKEIPLGAV